MAEGFQPPEPNGERVLAAIVFSDVVGYSARMNADEEATMRLVRRDFLRMKEVCDEHRGRVLQTMGDGLLLYFSSAVQAVAWALQVQREIVERAKTAPPAEVLEHRIGIHLGDVVLKEGGVVGDGVNIAARLQAEAEPNGICISQMVYDVVKNKLQLDATYLGPRELKNIREKIPVYRLIIAATDPSAPRRQASRGSATWSHEFTRGGCLKWAAIAVIGLATVGGLTLVGLFSIASRVVESAPPPATTGEAAPPARPRGLLGITIDTTGPGLAAVVPTEAPMEGPQRVAVLPFRASGDDAGLAEGLHEEILYALARNPGLGVLARGTVARYAADTRDPATIARELDATSIVEGSVRRAGARVRVGVALIEPRSGRQVWAETFDRGVDDIFALQTEIATRVSSQLQAELTPDVMRAIQRTPTENAEAYAAFQSGRELARLRGVTPGSVEDVLRRTAADFERATALDPAFAEAWAYLAVTYGRQFWAGFDPTPARLQLARLALARARERGPELPETHWAAGLLAARIDRDYDTALRELDRAQELVPNDAEVLAARASILRRRGSWDEAIRTLERMASLEPLESEAPRELASCHIALRQYDKAAEWADQVIANAPRDIYAYQLRAMTELLRTGSFDAVDAIMASAPEATSPEDAALVRFLLAVTTNRWEAALESARQLPDETPMLGPREISVATALWALGRDAEAREVAATAIPRLRALANVSANPGFGHDFLASALIMSGACDEALEVSRRGMEQLPISADAFAGPQVRAAHAITLALCGRADEAFPLLLDLARIPGGLHWVQLTHPKLVPLHADPRWAELTRLLPRPDAN